MLRAHGQHHEEGATQAVDPVCGMSVDIATAELKSTHDGTTYYFCSAGCKKSFDANPAKYVQSAHSPQAHQH